MPGEEQFDSFYRDTRQAVLLQSYALTGDLPAAHSVVRGAYTDAWHHWRKVSTSQDPQDWVRARAWRLAQTHHRGGRWQRRVSPQDAGSPALTALTGLDDGQRRALLLTELVGLPVADAARELAVTSEALERLREEATSSVAAGLGVGHGKVGARLAALTDDLRDARGGNTSSALDRDPGSPPDRATETATGSASPTLGSPSSVVGPIARPVKTLPSAGDLLDEDQMTRLGLGRKWRVLRTHDNTGGDGLNTTCQQARFADPDGISALVRSFEARGRPRRSAVQTLEVSESARQARRAFRTTVGWYAGCQVGRLQLLRAGRVAHIGDQADVLMVRVWKRPVTTYSVAIARSGRVVTSTVGRTVGAQAAPASEITQSLADSVAMLCASSGADDCAKQPTFAAAPPPPSGEERGVLAVADLPPVGRIDEPWVGTPARPAGASSATTICDRADFVRSGARVTRSRTFLIPGARLPDRFGISETYGVFATARKAVGFLTKIRGRVQACEKGNVTAEVSEPRSAHPPGSKVASFVWDLETEVSEDESVRFRLGLVRISDKVAHVIFSPTARRGMSPARFDALVVRAGDRLRELGSTAGP